MKVLFLTGTGSLFQTIITYARAKVENPAANASFEAAKTSPETLKYQSWDMKPLQELHDRDSFAEADHIHKKTASRFFDWR